MRWACFLATLVPLSGCAVPAALSVASLVVETGSYAISGKTVVDHGLSAVMDRDCALIRALEGSVCAEVRHYELAQAALTPLSGSGSGSGGGDLEMTLAGGAAGGAAGGPAGGPETPAPSYRWLLDPAVQIAERPADPEPFAADYLAAEATPVAFTSQTPPR